MRLDPTGPAQADDKQGGNQSRRNERSQQFFQGLFKRGWNTKEIATLSDQTEASVYNTLARARGATEAA